MSLPIHCVSIIIIEKVSSLKMGRASNAFDFKAFFLTIALSFFIIYTFILFQLGKQLDFVNKKVSSHKAYDDMKSGDLVVVSYNSLRGKLVKVFTGSAWVHSGLVICEQDKKYIIEVAYYDNEKYGVLMTPLKEWVDFNQGRVLGWRQYNGKNFPTKQILNIVKRDIKRDITPDMNSISWLRTLYKTTHNDKDYPDRDEFFCSEYIVHILQYTGVLKGYMTGYKPCGYKPWELFYGELPLINNHAYGNSRMVHG